MKIYLPQKSETREAPPRELLATVLHDVLETPCGGNGICGGCLVQLQYEGGEIEDVLACQTTIEHDCTVWCQDWETPESGELQSADALATIEAGVLQKPHGQIQHGGWLAVDIGTTTLATALATEAVPDWQFTSVRVNPQVRFGHDVISRLQYAQEHGTGEMQSVLLETLREMVLELCECAHIQPAEITRCAFAGNTTMEAILLGRDTNSLTCVPFTPPEGMKQPNSLEFPATAEFWRQMGLPEKTQLRIFPVFSGFVGGDITAGVVTCGLAKPQTRTTLMLDIGTNGEMVLSHQGRLMTCATAAGPAFEGACISCGSRAKAGAVNRVSSSNGKLQIQTIGDGPARSVCGSALIDLTAELLRLGKLLPDGQLTDGDRVVLAEGLAVTQADFRQIQLAVGAIRTGIRVLLEENGLKPTDLDALLVAGGFGSSLNVPNARTIGLIPQDVPEERVRFVGNASLAGAIACCGDDALSNQQWASAFAVLERSTDVNLAEMPQFADLFIESMFFPEPKTGG